jgi:hypothetical protein
VPKLKLTETDRVILAAAGARETGLVLPVPKSLKLAPTKLEAILRRLLGQGLLLERAAISGEKPWVTSEDGTRSSLVVAPVGLEAVGMGAGDASGANASTVDAGRSPRARADAKRPADPKRATKPKGKPPVTSSEPVEAARTTKLDMLIGALRQRKGATIAELMDATGWQAHSVRGSISGALKKRMSLNVVSRAVEGRGRVYRIEAETTK